MSLDTNTLLAGVKRAAIEAVYADKPFALLFGQVISVAPLKITVDQKMTLTTAQLILTNAVRDYTVRMTVDHTTGSAQGSVSLTHTHSYSGTTALNDTYLGTTENGGAKDLSHTHTYKGTKTFKVLLGLNTGEQVLLLRANGGQKFIVLDRVEAPA